MTKLTQTDWRSDGSQARELRFPSTERTRAAESGAWKWKVALAVVLLLIGAACIALNRSRQHDKAAAVAWRAEMDSRPVVINDKIARASPECAATTAGSVKEAFCNGLLDHVSIPASSASGWRVRADATNHD